MEDVTTFSNSRVLRFVLVWCTFSTNHSKITQEVNNNNNPTLTTPNPSTTNNDNTAMKLSLLGLTLSCLLLWHTNAGGKGSSKHKKAKVCQDCYKFNGHTSSCHECSNCLFYYYDGTCRPARPLKEGEEVYRCGCNDCNSTVLYKYAEGFT